MSLFLREAQKRFDEHLIFQDADLELHPGQCVALLGRNGTGKTTLMRALAGLESLDAGDVTRVGRVAYLAQRDELENGKLRDVTLPETHRHLKLQLEQAQASLEDPTTENLERYARLEEQFRVSGGYDLEIRAEEILAGLGLQGSHSSRALSGGQERRALLARLLIEPADYYLLDEPTNHLDLESIAWLESWILASFCGFLIVSHDRAFLDRVVQRCYELERQRLTEYPGNYTEAMAWKATERDAARVAFENHERKVKQLRHEQQMAAQQASRSENKSRVGNRDATTASHLANRSAHKQGKRTLALQKRIEHMGELEKPFEDSFLTKIEAGDVKHGPTEVLQLEAVTLARAGKTVLEDVDLFVTRGERIALVGPNGGGKSTLLAGMRRQLEPTQGSIKYGVGLTLYWAGQNTEELTGFATLEEALLNANPDLKKHDLYALLAMLGLPKDPARAISSLSGGQRTRLSLARLSVTKAHLLVLDEPTNNLDIDAIKALEKLLLEYPGTVVFASHDRQLIKVVATRIMRVMNEGISLQEL